MLSEQVWDMHQLHSHSNRLKLVSWLCISDWRKRLYNTFAWMWLFLTTVTLDYIVFFGFKEALSWFASQYRNHVVWCHIESLNSLVNQTRFFLALNNRFSVLYAHACISFVVGKRRQRRQSSFFYRCRRSIDKSGCSQREEGRRERDEDK